jgi:RNA recognition motif-containing protein
MDHSNHVCEWQVDAKKAVPESEGRRARESTGRVKKIFLGGLPADSDEASLKDFFAQFGTVDEVRGIYSTLGE